MGLEVKGITSLIRKMARSAPTTTERARRRLEKGAKQIAARAKAYAPVDTHDLEGAIKAVATREDTKNGRIEWIVGVDDSALDLGSRQGFDYAAQMHEAYPSSGPSTPAAAKRRAAKENAVKGSFDGPYSTFNGMIVGGKYLERAFNDYEDQIGDDLKQIMKEAFK